VRITSFCVVPVLRHRAAPGLKRRAALSGTGVGRLFASCWLSRVPLRHGHIRRMAGCHCTGLRVAVAPRPLCVTCAGPHVRRVSLAVEPPSHHSANWSASPADPLFCHKDAAVDAGSVPYLQDIDAIGLWDSGGQQSRKRADGPNASARASKRAKSVEGTPALVATGSDATATSAAVASEDKKRLVHPGRCGVVASGFAPCLPLPLHVYPSARVRFSPLLPLLFVSACWSTLFVSSRLSSSLPRSSLLGVCDASIAPRTYPCLLSRRAGDDPRPAVRQARDLVKDVSVDDDDDDAARKPILRCESCDFSTSYRHVLRRHYRVHTGERPFKCPYCDYSATQSGNLQYHVRCRHPEKPPLPSLRKKLAVAAAT
jgi:hypothetical protein